MRLVYSIASLNAIAPRVSEAEARRQHERDLAKIQRLGLVERARRDFTSRTPGATIERWTIGYLVDTDVLWCDVRYRVPDGTDTLQRVFGYRRQSGTDWSLIWDSQKPSYER